MAEFESTREHGTGCTWCRSPRGLRLLVEYDYERVEDPFGDPRGIVRVTRWDVIQIGGRHVVETPSWLFRQIIETDRGESIKIDCEDHAVFGPRSSFGTDRAKNDRLAAILRIIEAGGT